MCHAAGGDGAWAGYLGVGWLVFRLAYIPAYVADFAVVRSSLWVGGVGCAVGLIALAASH